MKYAFKVFVIISFSIVSWVTSVSSHKEDNAHEEWGPISAGPLTTWTAPLCGKGRFVIQPLFFYNRTRGTFNADGHYDPLPGGDAWQIIWK